MQVPLSQRRFTNVAVVRYTKNGVKLEIACYKNKVISYRSGTEDRLDEVLQVDRVFANVGRGLVASEKDIRAVFGPGMTEEEAIKFILEHGEVQVAQQERTAEVDELFKDISVIISQKCVNSQTQRPFPTVVIENALRSIGSAVKLDQPVKKQALAFIHQLEESQVIPIVRAKMKVRCTTSVEAFDTVIDWCAKNAVEVLERRVATAEAPLIPPSLVLLLPPHLFREIEHLVHHTLPAGSTLHMIETAVVEGGVIGSGGETDPSKSSIPTTHSPSRGTLSTSDRANEAEEPSLQKRGKGKRGKKVKARSTSPNTPKCGALKDLVDLNGDGGFAASDSESDDGGKKGKNPKRKKKNAASKPKPPPVVKEEVVEENSDAEVEGNRRQRKKIIGKKTEVSTYDDFDEENYDYGDEEEQH